MTRGSEVPRSTGCDMISTTSNELHWCRLTRHCNIEAPVGVIAATMR